MTTEATIRTSDSSHWYYTDGRPCYELLKADGKGMKTPTLADARKLNLLPSVTTILSILDKPALTSWKVEQGVLAVLTTPRLTGETDDAFVHRVLKVERVQDQEAATARDRGTEIHGALEDYFNGSKELAEDIKPWVMPAARAISARGQMVATEKILVGSGFAGKTDLIQEAPDCWLVWDFKSTKKLPDKGSWVEHVLQLCAYAAAYSRLMAQVGNNKPVQTVNCYISTVEAGSLSFSTTTPTGKRTITQDLPRWLHTGFGPRDTAHSNKWELT